MSLTEQILPLGLHRENGGDGVLTLPVDKIVIVADLYPRQRSAAEEDAAIERYRLAIDRLPPVVVARGNILVDGFHRIEAHKREKRETVRAIDLGELSDDELLAEAIQRNSTHGRQLTPKDKADLACRLWLGMEERPAGERTAEIMRILSVSEPSVMRWTKDARTQQKERDQQRAWELWLDCWSERAIGNQIGVPRPTVNDWLAEKRQMIETNQPPASRQHFDLWEFGTADEGGQGSYFGRMPPQVVENLLWLYTEPGQTVFDPFAGGGTTIDVAKRMGRRVWASDLKPANPLLPIHAHDITAGWPEKAPSRVDFILLDPPYWKQAKGRYSDDAHDLGNMALEEFNAAWWALVTTCVRHLEPGGFLAFIISPSADAPNVVDHAFDMCLAARDAGLVAHRRIIVAYQTQQWTGAQVTWARENRALLMLYRDLVVMRRG